MVLKFGKILFVLAIIWRLAERRGRVRLNFPTHSQKKLAASGEIFSPHFFCAGLSNRRSRRQFYEKTITTRPETREAGPKKTGAAQCGPGVFVRTA
jgi:hypothetical protein